MARTHQGLALSGGTEPARVVASGASSHTSTKSNNIVMSFATSSFTGVRVVSKTTVAKKTVQTKAVASLENVKKVRARTMRTNTTTNRASKTVVTWHGRPARGDDRSIDRGISRVRERRRVDGDDARERARDRADASKRNISYRFARARDRSRANPSSSSSRWSRVDPRDRSEFSSNSRLEWFFVRGAA